MFRVSRTSATELLRPRVWRYKRRSGLFSSTAVWDGPMDSGTRGCAAFWNAARAFFLAKARASVDLIGGALMGPNWSEEVWYGLLCPGRDGR